jgi:competence protein ComEC
VISVLPDGLHVEQRAGWSVRGIVAAARRRVVAGALSALPSPQGGLLLSLLLGIDTHLDPALAQQFSRAGLVHLMVVSGAQVAIVAGGVAWAARLARLSVGVATVATGLGVAAFAAMIDWAPSIFRAVIMTGVALGAVLLGRRRDSGAALAVAALALLAANPRVLFDVGFQLSFAATWGLLFVAPILQLQLSGLGRRLSEALSVTLGAQLAVAPLIAAHFQTVAVAGVVANILVVPIIAILVPAGFAIMPLIVLVPTVGGLLLTLLRPGLAAVTWVSARFGDLSWATMSTPPVSGFMAALLMGLMCAGVATWSGSRFVSAARRLTFAAACVAILGLWYGHASLPPRELVVTVLDVGQGDAILVQSPGGRAVLIDGGGEIGAERTGWDVGRMRVVPAMRRAGVRRLDVMLLSHPHEDHVGGLPAVLENLSVGIVLDPGVPHPSPSYMRLLRLVEAGRIPYRAARAGMILDLGASVGLTVLYPPDPIPMVGDDPVHAGAVVARLTYGATAMLFTGDAEAGVEQYLLDRGTTLLSQVLKVGHHGSRTSTTPAFLLGVRPQYAVISLGADNSFGHPHEVTLANLAAASVTVFRTDLLGAVRLTSDGLRWRISTARARSNAGVH